MTKTKKHKAPVARTVELNDKALDQAAAGAGAGSGETLTGIDFRPADSFYGTGVYKTSDGGRG